MVFEWSHRYKVDVHDVDEQHRRFVDVVNTLYEAMEQGEGPQVLEETLDVLVKYAEAHFQCEQKYMHECHYPDSARHMAAHADFVKTVKVLRQRLKTEDPKLFTVRLACFLWDWLIDHIQHEDKRLFDHRASKRQSPHPRQKSTT